MEALIDSDFIAQPYKASSDSGRIAPYDPTGSLADHFNHDRRKLHISVASRGLWNLLIYPLIIFILSHSSVDMGHAIERMERAEQMDREMNDPANPVLAGHPERPAPAADNKRGTASDAYKKAFWNSVRGRMNYDVRNALQVGELTEGGYTVPDEFENQLIEAL